MSSPLVSVLVPAYNTERFLGEALDSVLAQTWPNVEVIVVDDGSKDATLAVARQYESRGVRVIAQANAGAAAARNTAFAHCNGDFIQFFDADDILAQDKLEQQMRRLLEEPRGTIATSMWARFYGSDPNAACFAPHPDYRDYEVPRDWLVQAWGGAGTMPPLAWLMPRAVVEEAGPWNPALSLDDDGEYCTRVVLASRKIAFCGGARGYYRSGQREPQRAQRRPSATLAVRGRTAQHGAPAGREDSERTRHAAACYWQVFLFEAYPRVPELIREAERRVAALGGGSRRVEVSRPFRPVRDFLGWKAAVRLQRVYRRSGIEESVQAVKRWGTPAGRQQHGYGLKRRVGISEMVVR